MKRRTLLLGTAGLAVACSADPPALPPPTVSDSGPNRPVTVEHVRSRARGANVTLVVMRPADRPGEKLPVCVALHGRGSDARMAVQLGVPDLLRNFAMVGLDGGDSYWVARDERDDPQRMLTDELPGWLAERNLEPDPFAVFGLSMGAYGALNYARNTSRVVAALSPALFTSWADAESRNAFAGEEAWARTDPLQHVDELTGATIGVWCGAEDPFVDVARTFSDRVKPEVAAFAPGGHDAAYWLRTVPDVVRFVGDRAG